MKVDKDLLKLYSFYSVSGTKGEKDICNWIAERLKELGVSFERKGNTLYSFNDDSEILLSAHLDQVSTNGPAKHFYLEDNKTIVGYNEQYQRTSLGADDKNGVWIILKCLERGCKIDFIISESEEIGCKGIDKMKDELKKNAYKYSCCLVLDRRNSNEILESGRGGKYCKTLAYCLKNFLGGTYKVTSGSISDTQTICKYIESVNMSVAYEGAHTSLETTDYKELKRILEDVIDVIADFVHYPTDPKEYISTINTTGYSRYYGRGGFYDEFI